MITYDARKPCELTGRKFFFDTNVWININGFDPRPEYRVYSDYYASLLKAGNDVVVSDLVLSEFHNRCCKTQHALYQSSNEGAQIRFKAFRVRAEGRDFMESVRDTCLNIRDDCELDQLRIEEFDLSTVIEECTDGHLDYNDILIRLLCGLRGYVLVTHDRDFANCGLDVATANERFLKQANG